MAEFKVLSQDLPDVTLETHKKNRYGLMMFQLGLRPIADKIKAMSTHYCCTGTDFSHNVVPMSSDKLVLGVTKCSWDLTVAKLSSFNYIFHHLTAHACHKLCMQHILLFHLKTSLDLMTSAKALPVTSLQKY